MPLFFINPLPFSSFPYYGTRSFSLPTKNVRISPERALSFLFPPAPAVGTQLAGFNSHRIDHVIQPMITQGSEFQFFSDLVHHFFVVGAVRIRIIQQSVIISNSFPALNHAPARSVPVPNWNGKNSGTYSQTKAAGKPGRIWTSLAPF